MVWIYFTTFGGFMALTAWLPTYWTSFFGVSVITAGLLTAAFSILASLVRVVGGILADKLQEGGAHVRHTLAEVRRLCLRFPDGIKSCPSTRCFFGEESDSALMPLSPGRNTTAPPASCATDRGWEQPEYTPSG